MKTKFLLLAVLIALLGVSCSSDSSEIELILPDPPTNTNPTQEEIINKLKREYLDNRDLFEERVISTIANSTTILFDTVYLLNLNKLGTKLPDYLIYGEDYFIGVPIKFDFGYDVHVLSMWPNLDTASYSAKRKSFGDLHNLVDIRFTSLNINEGYLDMLGFSTLEVYSEFTPAKLKNCFVSRVEMTTKIKLETRYTQEDYDKNEYGLSIETRDIMLDISKYQVESLPSSKWNYKSITQTDTQQRVLKEDNKTHKLLSTGNTISFENELHPISMTYLIPNYTTRSNSLSINYTVWLTSKYSDYTTFKSQRFEIKLLDDLTEMCYQMSR